MKSNPLRFILAIVVGIFVCYFISLFFQIIFPSIFQYQKMPAESSYIDFIAYLNNLPNNGFLALLLSFYLGIFFGAYIAARIAKERKKDVALACGIFTTILAVFYVIVFPHPLWFSILLCSMLAPLSILGGRFAGK